MQTIQQLINSLTAYKDKRQKSRWTFKSPFGGQFGGYSKQQKLDACDHLIEFLKDSDSSKPFDYRYLPILLQGDLGKIVEPFVYKLRDTKESEILIINKCDKFYLTYCFINREKLKILIIPGDVKKICKDVFKSCHDLERIDIGEGVQEFDSGSFQGCNQLKKIRIPSSVKKIKGDAFSECESLEEVEIGKYVEKIDGLAFRNCKKLKKIKIQCDSRKIDTDAFAGCNAVEEVEVGEGIRKISSRDFLNIMRLKKIRIPDSVEIINDNAFINSKYLERVEIGKRVQHIGFRAFKNCKKLKNLVIPGSVKNIEEEAFLGCDALETIEIGEGVETIGPKAFYDCKNLKKIVIPSSVKKIDHLAFTNCEALESIEIKNGVETIGCSAFEGCKKLKNIIIPGSVGVIPDRAFADCEALEAIEIGKGVKKIGFNAFENCKSLKKIVIPGSVKKINPHTFKNCEALEELEIQEGVEEIDPSAFVNCKKLKKIIIPGSVKNIASGGLYYNHGIFEDCKALEVLEIGEGVEEIGFSAFAGCNSLKELTIPSSVKKIRQSAFYGCRALRRLQIGEGVEEIGEHVFSGCKSLSKVILCSDTQIAENTFKMDFELQRDLCTFILHPKVANAESQAATPPADDSAEAIIASLNPGRITILKKNSYEEAVKVSDTTCLQNMPSASKDLMHRCIQSFFPRYVLKYPSKNLCYHGFSKADWSLARVLCLVADRKMYSQDSQDSAQKEFFYDKDVFRFFISIVFNLVSVSIKQKSILPTSSLDLHNSGAIEPSKSNLNNSGQFWDNKQHQISLKVSTVPSLVSDCVKPFDGLGKIQVAPSA